MIKKLLLILLVCFSSKAHSQIINEKLVEKHLTTLADDLMEGRKAGSQGIEMAAKYIESEFERIGLDKFESQNSFRDSLVTDSVVSFNVVGQIGKYSPKRETILIGAHLDHIGVQNIEGDNVFNGANDNAAGSTAVMQISRFLAQHSWEKNIIVALFADEEKGLKGAHHLADRLKAENIIAGINIEMIGKESPFGPKTAWLTGFDRSDFGQIIQKNLEESDYSLYPDPYVNFRLFFRSDNASLARLGVPSHTFSTSPMDKDLDYHKVSDETKTLDLFTVSETIKAIAIGTLSIVNGNDTPSRIVMKKDEPFK